MSLRTEQTLRSPITADRYTGQRFGVIKRGLGVSPERIDQKLGRDAQATRNGDSLMISRLFGEQVDILP